MAGETKPKEEKPTPLDEETFHRLLEEGRELRKAFDKASRPMRILTTEDWLRRSR